MPREPETKEKNMPMPRDCPMESRDWLVMFFDRPQPEGMGLEWFLTPFIEQERN
jgi:hypothetical protein